MFAYLRGLAARLLNKPEWLDGLPEDPSVFVREPRRRNPNGRNSAIALDEPEPESFVEAVSARATRRKH
jgi:hypothetical protein